MEPKRKVITLSYDGGGWTFFYALGFTKYVQEKIATLPNIDVRYAGISAGSCVGLAAALGVPMDDLYNEGVKWSKWCRMFPMLATHAIRCMCHKFIKDDATARLLDSFAVNVTSFTPRPRPNVFSRFISKTHLVNLMTSTCTIPLVNSINLWSGHFDGGFSARFFEPPWESDEIYNISPWSHRARPSSLQPKVHPVITPPFKIPWYRLIIPFKEEKLNELSEQGYKDAEAAFAAFDPSFGMWIQTHAGS